MRPAEQRIMKLILNCAVYKAGGVFPLHEMQRSLPSHTEYVSVARLREVVNAMIDQGSMERVPTPGGETNYRAASKWRKRLLSPWAKVPADCDHSPRWF